jgi:hypothetical protein
MKVSLYFVQNMKVTLYSVQNMKVTLYFVQNMKVTLYSVFCKHHCQSVIQDCRFLSIIANICSNNLAGAGPDATSATVQ